MERYRDRERASLLADVAEMYFLDGLIQDEIGKRVGVTRSMVSRMLAEARRQGIVEIIVHRPVMADHDLTSELIKRFGLKDAFVVADTCSDHQRLLRMLGHAGVVILERYLRPSMTVGIVWGTATNAVVDALPSRDLSPINVVQLAGAVDAQAGPYDGHALVTRLAQKLNGRPFYLNAPLVVDNPETVAALNAAPSVNEAIVMGRKCDIAVLGIGGTDPAYCSYCLTGNITPAQLARYVEAGAVGVVYANYYASDGTPVQTDLCGRIVGLDLDSLLRIPIRIGIAGDDYKAAAIEGALRGGYVNVLVTDSRVASRIATNQPDRAD